MEVTHLPLFKILAYIYFGRGEFVLPPIVYEWGMEGQTVVFRTSLNQMCFAAHRVRMGSEVVVSRLIEVTNLPLFRASGNRADGLSV